MAGRLNSSLDEKMATAKYLLALAEVRIESDEYLAYLEGRRAKR